MVQWELDSFYVKFKNLLRAEKDATLTLKAEAGRASVTLSLDLGHVLSEHDQFQPHRLRNGPARQRRREKRAAARAEKVLAEAVEAKDVEPAEKVEEVLATNSSAAEEAAVLDSVAKSKELYKSNEKTTEKVEETVRDLKDEVCPDEIYRCQNQSKLVSVGTQTLECGVAHTQSSKSMFDYYTLRYDDSE